MNQKKKILIIIICSFVLSCTFFITYFTYAIYKSSSSNSSANIIATWDVSATSNDSDINLIVGAETDTYTLTIDNDSDVEVKYSIQLSSLPNDIQVKLDNGSYVTPVNNEVTFTNVGQLDYTNTTTRSHTLTFSTTSSTNELSNQNIGINVIFEQL